MAYVTQYTANFTNEVEQTVECLIQKKNGSSVSVTNLPVAALKINDSSDDQSSYACIITKELTLTVWADLNSTITWNTFLPGAFDDWKITVTVDSEVFFIGFVTPEEGNAPFQDKPYEITIKAIDGLGLIKGKELVKTNGDLFFGRFKMSDYLAAILKTTGLDLPIRVYCTYLNRFTQNKYDSMTIDLFNTAYLNYKTFLKTGREYENCYDALKILLSGWCNIQQYQGRWQVMCLSDRQKTPNTLYYVDYDVNGNAISGNFNVEGPARVGRYELIYPSIYPVNENQKISAQFANQETKLVFNYNVFDNVIDNLNQSYYTDGEWAYSDTAYDRPTSTTVVGTRYGYGIKNFKLYTGSYKTSEQTLQTSYLPLIMVEKDAYENEIQRYFEIEVINGYNTTNLGTFIKNENNDFVVDQGDSFDFSVTFRILNVLNSNNSSLVFNDFSGFQDTPWIYSEQNQWAYIHTCYVMLLKKGKSGADYTDWYILWEEEESKIVEWKALSDFNLMKIPGSANFYLSANPKDSDETNQWKTVSLNKASVPESGTVYVHFSSGITPSGWKTQFKDIRIDYKPSVSGSKFNIKGDYHVMSQNLFFPDKSEKEIKISDISKTTIKGALLKENGDNMLSAFYRFPSNENKPFKYLVNRGFYNHTFRRMLKVEGEFTSLMYNDYNDQEVRKPIGFHKLFRFADMIPQKDFVLIPSLEMDILTGNIKATFVEAYGQTGDGENLGDKLDKIGYIF